MLDKLTVGLYPQIGLAACFPACLAGHWPDDWACLLVGDPIRGHLRTGPSLTHISSKMVCSRLGARGLSFAAALLPSRHSEPRRSRLTRSPFRPQIIHLVCFTTFRSNSSCAVPSVLFADPPFVEYSFTQTHVSTHVGLMSLTVILRLATRSRENSN